MSKGELSAFEADPLFQLAFCRCRSVTPRSMVVPEPNVEPLAGWFSEIAGARLSMAMLMMIVRMLLARSVAVTVTEKLPSAHVAVETSNGEEKVTFPLPLFQ